MAARSSALPKASSIGPRFYLDEEEHFADAQSQQGKLLDRRFELESAAPH
jgi:hypothetical protein